MIGFEWSRRLSTEFDAVHLFDLPECRCTLPRVHGRGFDDLPSDLKEVAAAAFVRSADRSELLRALRQGTGLLLAEGAAASVCPPRLSERVGEFMSAD